MTSFSEQLQQLDDNERTLLNLLRYEGAVTRQKLQERMGLSSSTMHRLTRGLEEMDLISQRGEGESGGGRKPVLYGMGKGTGLLAGVELSRTEVRMLLCHSDLVPVERMRFSLTAQHGPDETADTIAIHFREAMTRQGAVPSDIPGIGLGTVGSLDRERGMICRTTGFRHEGWQEVPISRMLSQRLGIPVHLDNGANLAVLAERLAGSGRGVGTLAYIHLGMGIRTGIFSRGEILRYFGESLDAFGHLSVDINGLLCDCGNRGCMETVATLPALAVIVKNPDAPEESGVRHELENLVGAQGESSRRLEQAATIFGAGLATLVRMTDSRLVILSGPVIRLSRRFYETAVQSAQRYMRGLPDVHVRFERDGHFGEWAISTGAAAHVFELFLRTKDARKVMLEEEPCVL